MSISKTKYLINLYKKPGLMMLTIDPGRDFSAFMGARGYSAWL